VGSSPHSITSSARAIKCSEYSKRFVTRQKMHHQALNNNYAKTMETAEPIDDAAEALLEVWPSTTDGVIALLLLHVGELEGTRGPPHLAPSLCHGACALIRPRR
jgi:hypothetical protein